MNFATLRRFMLALGITAFAGSMPLAAQERLGASEWTGQITLQAWGVGVQGDIKPFRRGPSLSFDESLSDILQDLDAAAFVTGFARRGDLVVFGDLTYSSSSRDGRVLPGVKASGELKHHTLTLAAGKRVLHGETSIDLMAGLRASKIEGKVKVRVPLVSVSVSPERELVDPIVAMRINTRLAPRWTVLTYVDLGGFGAGSDFTWQLAVTANYELNENVYLSAGYRHLAIDYKKNGTEFDAAMTGPLLGLTWRF